MSSSCWFVYGCVALINIWTGHLLQRGVRGDKEERMGTSGLDLTRQLNKLTLSYGQVVRASQLVNRLDSRGFNYKDNHLADIAILAVLVG